MLWLVAKYSSKNVINHVNMVILIYYFFRPIPVASFSRKNDTVSGYLLALEVEAFRQCILDQAINEASVVNGNLIETECNWHFWGYFCQRILTHFI